MKEKINSNIEKERYLTDHPKSAALAYSNREGGWVDHLLSENVIFSHRKNRYASGELPEKLHAHDYYELTLIASREGVEYISEGQGFSVAGGTAVLTKPNHFHMFRLPCPMYYDRYVIYFKNPERLFPKAELMRFTEVGSEACAVFKWPDKSLLTYVERAEQALCASESPCAAAEAYLALCQLLLSLSEHRQPPEAGEVERLPSFIGEVKEYIDKNYLQIESTGALAEKFFYSREHISRAFKRYYNTSVYEYILDKRLLYCQACLKRGERIELAAHHAGFVNMSSFFKIFKKRCGCSPSEYKTKQ